MKKLLTAFAVGIFIIAGLFVAHPSFAQQANTASVLQSLLEQLSALQAQLSKNANLAQVSATTTATSTSSWCHDFVFNVKFLDTNSEVSDLQKALTLQGYTIPASDLGGYGQSTANAVVNFQRDNGLTVTTGLSINASTQAKLNALYGCTRPTAPTLIITKNSAVGTQTVVANAVSKKIGSYTLKASTGENIKVSTVTITTGAAGFNFQNLKLIVGGAQFGAVQTVLGNSTPYTFSGTQFTVPSSGVTLDVYADVLANASVGTKSVVTTLSDCSASGATTLVAVSCASTAGQDVVVAGAASLTATNNSTGISPSQIVMGTAGNNLGAFRFTNTSNVEDIKITDVSIIDDTTANAKSSFANLTLYQNGSPVGTSLVSPQRRSSNAYVYKFTFSAPITVSAGNAVTLALKGDVATFSSSAATDNSFHTFRISDSADVIALGVTSNAPATINVQAGTLLQIQVLRTKLAVTANGLGATSGRTQQAIDELGTIVLAAESAGSAALNSLAITFNGTQSADFMNSVALIDPSTGISVVANGATTSFGGNRKQWIFGTGSAGLRVEAGSTKTLRVRVDSTKLTSQTLSAVIANYNDITYTDGVDSSASTNISPTNIASSPFATINSVAYEGVVVVVPTHKACVTTNGASSCSVVSGAGADSCTTNSQCVVAVPSITIISPNGGEQFQVGKGGINVKYISRDIVGKKITASLWSEGLNTIVRGATGIASNTGSIGIDLVKAGPDLPGKYQVSLCVDGLTGSDGKDLCDWSNDYIHLTPPPIDFSVASITVNPASPSANADFDVSIFVKNNTNITIPALDPMLPQVSVDIFNQASGENVYSADLSFAGGVQKGDGSMGSLATALFQLSTSDKNGSIKFPAGKYRLVAEVTTAGKDNVTKNNIRSVNFTVQAPAPTVQIDKSICSVPHEAGKMMNVVWSTSDSARTVDIDMMAAGDTKPVPGAKRIRATRTAFDPLEDDGVIVVPEALPAGNYELVAKVSGGGKSSIVRSCTFAVTAAPLPTFIFTNTDICTNSYEPGDEVPMKFSVSENTQRVQIDLVSASSKVTVFKDTRDITDARDYQEEFTISTKKPVGKYELVATVTTPGKKTATTKSCALTISAPLVAPVAPKISSLFKTSGPVGSTVTIAGSGFGASANTINFGSNVIPSVSSADGTSLTFTVPEYTRPACLFANPACDQRPAKITAGVYSVFVSNSSGNSNSIQFTVTPVGALTRVSAADSTRACPGGYANTLDTSKVGQIANSVAGGWLEGNGYLKTYSDINAGVDGTYVYGNASLGFNDSCANGVKMFFSGVLDATDRNRDACVVEIPMIACIRGTTYIGQNPTCNYPNTMVGGVCTPPLANGSISGFSVLHVSNTNLPPINGSIVSIDGGSSVTTNPTYTFPSVTPNVQHTISAKAPAGYTLIGYTTSNPNADPISGNASVTVAPGESATVWWHFAAPTPAAKGMIQGYRVDQSNSKAAIGLGSEIKALRVGGGGTARPAPITTTASPYGLSLEPGTYEVSAGTPSGYTLIGYTLCVNSTSCHDATPTAGDTAVVTVASNIFYDLWWHYKPIEVTGSGIIQGYTVHHVSNTDLRPFPAGSVTVRVNGGLVGSSSNNPYGITVPSGTYTVSANPPSGWEWATIGYTMCPGGSFCHNGTVTKGSSVPVTVTPNSLTDIWWHFGDASAMTFMENSTQQMASMLESARALLEQLRLRTQ